MCFPFFHKWKFEQTDYIRVFENWNQINRDMPAYSKRIYLGTCEKCGTIKRKVIKT